MSQQSPIARGPRKPRAGCRRPKMRSESELFQEGQFTGFTPEETAELRERFVQNRFAESKYFGRPDIEEWIREYASVDRPDKELERWEHILRLADRPGFGLDGKSAELLRAFGTRYGRDCFELPENFREPRSGFGWAHVLAHRSRYEVYLTDESVVLLQSGGDGVIVLDTGARDCGVWQGRLLTRQTILRSALLAWRSAKGELLVRAGEFVKTYAQRCIAAVRTKAEADFNGAVAVSADGTRIVAADKVLVIGEPQEEGERIIVVHPAQCFTERKILLDPDEYRTARLEPEDTEELRASLQRPGVVLHPQERRSFQGRSVLLTFERYVPPLETTT